MYFKKSLSVLVLLAFLVSSVGYADAASSSFSSGRSSSPSSSGFSRGSSSSPSLGSSSSKTGSGFGSSGSSSSSSTGGFFKSSSPSPAYAGPAAPTNSKPPGSFTNSSGSSVGQQKTGSAFGGQDAPKQTTTTGSGSTSYNQKTYTPVQPRYNASNYTTYNTNTQTIIIRDRPVDYTPRYFGTTVVVNRSPVYNDLWWQFEMLETIHDIRQREALMRQIQSNPNYAGWRDEANRLSGENAALKAQLNQADHPDQNFTPATEPVKKSGSHWFLWLLLICAIGAGGYFLFKRNQ